MDAIIFIGAPASGKSSFYMSDFFGPHAPSNVVSHLPGKSGAAPQTPQVP